LFISGEEGKRLCTACRKRDAVYRRISSGEVLCKLCLFRSLVKQVRKAIHYYKMVSRSSSVLYVIRPEAVAESVIGFIIYKKATKDFNLVYNVLCIDKLTNCDEVKHYIGQNNVGFITIESSFKPQKFVELVKYLDAVAVKISKKLKINSVAVPLFRDELSLLSLLGILTISRTIFSEGLPIKNVDSIKITRPFFYVISIDIAMLKVLEGVDIDPQFLMECDSFMQKAKKILFNSVELMYSNVKTVELMQSYIFGISTRCKYCGAFSLNEVCEICSRLSQYIDEVN
jgi:hypothetical protein